MKKKLLLAVTVVLVLVLGIGGFMVGRQMLDYRRGRVDYADAARVARLPDQPEGFLQTVARDEGDDPYAALLAEIDLAALREVNQEVVGWILLPDTNLSYPILQTSNNSYYLNHTWKGEQNSVGAIFLECKVSADFSDFNTIIYGHRMLDVSMFGTLKSYKDLSYWEEHPSVYVVTDEGVRRYDVYAAYECGLREITYGLDITSEEVKENFIQFGLGQSVIDTGIVPAIDDSILTMSTCTGNGHATRWVVQAVCRPEAG